MTRQDTNKPVKKPVKTSFLEKLKEIFFRRGPVNDQVAQLKEDYLLKQKKRPPVSEKTQSEKTPVSIKTTKSQSSGVKHEESRGRMSDPHTLQEKIQEARTLELTASELLQEIHKTRDEKLSQIVNEAASIKRASVAPSPIIKEAPSASPFSSPTQGEVSRGPIGGEAGPKKDLVDKEMSGADTLCKLSDESIQILHITRQNFPVLQVFMENLLGWIEQNLGHGLLGKSLHQIYSTDADFELEPDDFIIRFLQGIQINNLSPLIKIIYLRVFEYLEHDLAEEIIRSVSAFERKIRIDRLVEIFPWQKKRSVIRKILVSVMKQKENEFFDQIEKTTREKTKELTIKKWLGIIAQQDFFEDTKYSLIKNDLTDLAEEFRKSTAETRLLVVNVEEMIAQAEQEKLLQVTNDVIIAKINDLQDRKTRLIEHLYVLLEKIPTSTVQSLRDELETIPEIDVFTLLSRLLSESISEKDRKTSPLLDMFRWREELRIKEALKRMYFISRAFKHDLLSRSLLILGCLTETDSLSYQKKVKKIDSLYGFDLTQQLKGHPFNPNSTKAITPNGKKFTLQFEQKTIGSEPKEDMILYREGSILAQLLIPIREDSADSPELALEGTMLHLHRCAYGLETMIHFYHSHDEIMQAIRSKQLSIWDEQGLTSLQTMIDNKQSHFLMLPVESFSLKAFQWQKYLIMGYIVGKLIDDIFIPLGNQVKSELGL
ncbi:hypothetical protein JXQ70_05105 [bacterium]|nr:hypothetical protein [bacterium]